MRCDKRGASLAAVEPAKPSDDAVKVHMEEEKDSAKMIAALTAENDDLKRRLTEMRASMLDHPTDDEEDGPCSSSLKRKLSEVVYTDTDMQTDIATMKHAWFMLAHVGYVELTDNASSAYERLREKLGEPTAD
tara:strand:- start:2010 stop:2408 length:399 start_codon:yes stop_codon:yes gene_type:complete